MAKFYDCGNVNLEKARETILRNGGGESLTHYRDGTVHHSLYLKTCNWHLSWDEHPDGMIDNVHSDLNNKARWGYKGVFE